MVRAKTAAQACAAVQAATSIELVRHDAGADLAGDAGAAEPAIAHRVLGEILLVIVLGEVELRRVEDLRGDRAIALHLQRLLVLGLRELSSFALRRRGDV